jgi:hypothetical protein
MTEHALAKVEPQNTAIARASELEVSQVVARVEKIRAIAKDVMVEGRHFGKIPGVDKPTLLKPGAEILCMTFQLAPRFKLKEKRTGDHLETIATCTLIHVQSGAELGSADGSCSTREAKYAWRKGGRTCPECGKTGTINKSKHEPEWYCWKKKDGCGETFALDDERITSQNPDRVPNPDLPDTWNTVRKMAEKRALVAAVLIVTCASDLYTQDVEEQGRGDSDDGQHSSGESGPIRGTAAASNGNARPKPQAVATEKDVQDLIALIQQAGSEKELDALQKGAKNRQFDPKQRQRLSTADRMRRVELTPDTDDYAAQDRAVQS